MKTIFLVLTLLLICRSLPAPGLKELIILKPESINPYNRIFDAICKIESNNNPLAFCIDINGLSSVGIAQIQNSRIIDFNRHTGNNYSLNDMYSPELSKVVFMHFASRINHNDIERVCKKWNGTVAMTEIYWNKIKIIL